MSVGPVTTPGGNGPVETIDQILITSTAIPGYGLVFEEPPNSVGWYFEVVHTNGLREQLGFALDGEFSFDTNREVCKVLSGFVLIPSEKAKVDFSTDKIIAWLEIDEVRYPMGIFCFTEVPEQKDVVIDDEGTTTDLYTVSLGDRTVELIRNDGSAVSLPVGFDPAQEMIRIMDQDRIPNAIPGGNGQAASPVSWDGSVTDLTKVRGLATLSGFRFPWMNNAGVITAIVAGEANDFDVYNVEDLFPVAGSIVITPKYLAAPNRVIVSDNGFAGYPIRGQWDAPASAPHSYTNLGYYRTEVVEEQGLGSGQNANAVARRIGESFTARTLDFECMPTYLLDGPIMIRYNGAYWIVQSWSISTAAGATMSVSAQEWISNPGVG